MAMTDKQKGLMDELTDALSDAGGGVMTGSFINEIKGLMDALSEGGGVSEFDIQPYTSVQPQGYDQMINQGYDSWSPSDGIPGEGNPHIGETISNLGLPDTAQYQPGSNWGGGKYNYQKNVYDIQTIEMMINQKAIDPKIDQIIPRPDIGENQYEVKLAQTDNTLWNDQLQMFMSPDWLRTGSMGGDSFKDNYMGGQGNYDSLRSNTYPGSSNQLLDFNRYS
jgi:hypothetical protein